MAGLAVAALAAAAVIYLATDRGTVQVHLSDPNAAVDVTIDGELVPRSQADPTVRVRAGDHLLEVAGKDYKAVSKTFTVKRGDDVVLEVTLEPLVKPDAAEKPRRAQAALARARDHLQKHETEPAIAAATLALADDPTLAEAYLVRAEAQAAMAKWDAVIRDCTAALTLRPKAVEAHVLRAYLTRGSAYSLTGDNAKAIADFTAAIDLDANCSRAYLQRGLIYVLQKEDAKAQADFAKAKQLAPDLKAKIPRGFADAPP